MILATLFWYLLNGLTVASLLNRSGYAQGLYYLWAVLFWPVFLIWILVSLSFTFWEGLEDVLLLLAGSTATLLTYYFYFTTKPL